MRPAIVLVALLWAGSAHANLAAVRLHPAGLVAPSFEAGSPLQVAGERLVLDCEDADGALRCRLEAAYDVVNPTVDEVRVVGAFFGVQTRELVVTAANRVVSRELTAEERARLDKVLERLEAERRESRPKEPAWDVVPERFGFELQVPPGGRVELVARGRLEPEERFVPRGYSLPAVEARHPLLGRAGRARSWDLRYLLAPIWAWQGEPRVEVTLRTPPGIALAERDWAVTWEQGRRVARKNLVARDAPGVLLLPLKAEPATLEPGGVLLGVGGFWGDESGLRLRVGYEAGAMGWLLGSLVAETDAQRRLQLVPALEAALPAVLVLPSLGLGLGVPVELLPEVRAAARLQASAMFFPVGVLFTVDLFPRAGPSPARWEFALLFQASL